MASAKTRAWPRPLTAGFFTRISTSEPSARIAWTRTAARHFASAAVTPSCYPEKILQTQSVPKSLILLVGGDVVN